jgi:hypothetical protein
VKDKVYRYGPGNCRSCLVAHLFAALRLSQTFFALTMAKIWNDVFQYKESAAKREVKNTAVPARPTKAESSAPIFSKSAKLRETFPCSKTTQSNDKSSQPPFPDLFCVGHSESGLTIFLRDLLFFLQKVRMQIFRKVH